MCALWEELTEFDCEDLKKTVSEVMLEQPDNIDELDAVLEKQIGALSEYKKCLERLEQIINLEITKVEAKIKLKSDDPDRPKIIESMEGLETIEKKIISNKI